MMSDYEKYILCLQSAVALAAFLSVYLVLRQIKVLSSQLQATQQASEAQSIISIVQFLQSNDARNARETVRVSLSLSHHDQWTEEQTKDAAFTCANYDVVAALLRADLIKNKQIIIENWAPSIQHCHQVLAPFIEKKRIGLGGHPKYWNNFEWLRSQCSAEKA